MLALFAIVFGWLVYFSSNNIPRVLWFLLWIIFAPNTLYLIADSLDFPAQYNQLHGIYILYVGLQYGILAIFGAITFIATLYPFEKLLLHSKYRKEKYLSYMLLTLLNLILSFGVGLERIQRVNLWEFLTTPGKVLVDSITLISSNQSLLFILLFTLIANLIYFYSRRLIIDAMSELLYERKYRNDGRFL